jgi:hypothetical protein
MRVLAMTMVAIGTLSAAVPARAQAYDPDYPVCLHVVGPGISYYECRYTSLAQCKATAAGRPAQCDFNPYFAAADPAPARHHRRHHRRAH